MINLFTLRSFLLGIGLISACGISTPRADAAEANAAETVADSANRKATVTRRETERHFASLIIGELTYTNVWVHRQTNFNILIRHSGGIDTIKLTDLLQSELDALRPQLGELANIQEVKESEIVSRLKDMQQSEIPAAYRVQLETRWKDVEPMLMALLLPVLGGLVLVHFISSFFISSLCKKTNTKAGLEVWLPLVNQTALLRAGGLPGVWALLGFMAPLIPVAVFSAQLLPLASLPGMIVVAISALFVLASAVVWIVWCFKICIARQKSGWLGILLLIPGLNLLTITYLAFAD